MNDVIVYVFSLLGVACLKNLVRLVNIVLMFYVLKVIYYLVTKEVIKHKEYIVCEISTNFKRV